MPNRLHLVSLLWVFAGIDMVKSVKSLEYSHPILRSGLTGQGEADYQEGWVAHSQPSLRGQVSTDYENTWTRISRNLLLSFVLLIGVLVAGSLSVRDITSEKPKQGRECPLNPWISKMTSTKCPSQKIDKSLEDYPGDWDKILTSAVYRPVLDPTVISVETLLALPPPTFKSKVDLATVGPYMSLVHRMRSSKQYITVSE